MASSSVSQEDHDVEHDFAMASRRAKVRSARANRALNTYTTTNSNMRGEELERELEGHHEMNIRYEANPGATNLALVEQTDSSPKPVCRGGAKDKRVAARGGHAHAGKCNKGVRDRRKLREKRRSTGVMHVPSTESTGGSTGEDENNENTSPSPSASVVPKPSGVNVIGIEFEEKVVVPVPSVSIPTPSPSSVSTGVKQGRSESDLDADDEANNSGDVRGNRDETGQVKIENDRLSRLLEAKDKRIAALEMQVAQITRQMSEIREENAKLLRVLRQSQNSTVITP